MVVTCSSSFIGLPLSSLMHTILSLLKMIVDVLPYRLSRRFMRRMSSGPPTIPTGTLSPRTVKTAP